jgi:hypothetical protein
MSDSYLQSLVINKCKDLGVETSATFFEVSEGLVRQWVNGSKTPSLAAVEKVFSVPESKPTEAAWEGKEVFIAAPFYKSTNPATLTCLLGVWDRAKFGFRPRFGDAFIVHARNQLATDFLDSKMPYIWWIDDDMIVPMGNAGFFNTITDSNIPDKFAGIHTPNRFRASGKSLIGATYFGRNAYGKGVYAEAMAPTAAGRIENLRAHEGPIDEIRPTDWIGTGCLWHTRQVLLDIQEKFPHLAPQHPTEQFHFFTNTADGLINSMSEIKAKASAAVAEITTGTAAKAAEIIGDMLRQIEGAEKDALTHNRLQQGEDQLFCHRASQAGHQPFVDLGIVCGHVGSTVWMHHNTKVK